MRLPYTFTSEAIKGYSDSTLAKSERADCVVRAVASAYDMPYDKAHKWVADTFGRRHRRGTFGFPGGMDRMSANATRLNRKLTRKIDAKYLTTNGGKSKMSVGTFAKEYNKGLMVEPTCLLVLILTWSYLNVLKSTPPTQALTSPVNGSTAKKPVCKICL